MPRTVTIAAVQMEAAPAPTPERLGRAERLAEQARAAGAQLVALPELFNTGYEYSEQNFARAETSAGPTLDWMHQTAASLQIHLAGTLLLHERGEIFNAMFLVAPDGRSWRYDKIFPWGWERTYFRGGRAPVIASTSLGRFGMMICWDTAHRALWRHYAGQVDAMLICSCPPDVSEPRYLFRDGCQLGIEQMGPLMGSIKGSGSQLFGAMLNEQAGWLGVPAVNTVGCGQISTRVPRGWAALLMLVPSAPWLARYIARAGGMQMRCQMIEGTKIVGADGGVLAQRGQAQGEGFAIATVDLAGTPPQPRGAQPPSRVPPFAYLSSDTLMPSLVAPLYRRGLRALRGR